MAKNRSSLLPVLIFLFTGQFVHAQDSLVQRIILVGDAGEQAKGIHPELEFIKKSFPLDKRTTLVFLGDNIYPQGLPPVNDRNYPDKKAILDSQINVVSGTSANTYFIAGNHDWMQGRAAGYQQVLHQYRYIESQKKPNVHFVPADACPGPQEISLSKKVTLVVIDSQWWLHKFDKPTVGSGCECNTEAELLASLQEIVNRNEDKLLIFAAHHPFVTFGRHGGYYNLKQHIFPFTELNPKLYIPLPVLGSIYPIARGVFGNIQDTKHPIYKNFISQVDSILKQHPYCIRAAGHEHNLQLIKKDKNYYIVSGAGSKNSPITESDDLIFSSMKTGFATIDIINNGRVYVKFYSSENDTATIPMFTEALPPLDSTPVKRKMAAIPVFPDSITVPAASYYKAGSFKKWLLGANYRQEWITPVKVKVFDLGKEHGGLTVTKRGGGMQTKSLRLEDKNKREYVLRSVEKFPDATLPEEFRQTIIKDAVVDGISASYPFAALSVPALSVAAKVPHVTPILVYLPNDPRLGYYQKDFGNTLCIFEEREPLEYGENKSTEKIIENIREDNDNKIDQQAVLKARLLDMFIMDFDRHEDQWRWNTRDTGKGKVYYPLPRDRDQAFFVNKGFIPSFLRKPWRLPKFQGFRAKAINITTFNFNARYFDRSFLNSLSEQEWKNQADTLISQMTDSVIENAIRQQPPEIFPYSGNKIIATLKERRKHLKNEAVAYYKFLSNEVEITGTDKKELFEVKNNEDGSVEVEVFKINKDNEKADTLYSRKFLAGETKEIRLFGLDGKDSFHLTGNSGNRIRLRLSGGDGKDSYVNESSVQRKNAQAYDFTGDHDDFAGNIKKHLSGNPSVNVYNRKTFKYDILQPKLTAAYNRDDGLFLGAGIKHTAHGFRKEPYKVVHELKAQHSLITKAYRFQYNMIATDVIGSSDFIIHADLRAPNNTINFFGVGNNTKNEINDNRDARFYRTRFFNGDLALLLRREIAPDIDFYYGPTFQVYKLDSVENIGRVVSLPHLIQLDSAGLYNRKYYAGLGTGLIIDNRNDEHYPTRGVKWTTTAQFNKGLGSTSKNFTQLSTDLAVYISSNIPSRMVIAMRFGGAVNLGSFEFYQSQFLSGTENLRGYRKYRFAGDKMFFNNLDVRIRLKDYQGYLFTGSYGILLFHDIGRVWADNENSGRWHNGYGAGAWVSPAHRFVLTASYMRSKEEGLPLVSFGFQF